MNQHHNRDVGAIFSNDSSLNLVILKVTHDDVTKLLKTLNRMSFVQSRSFPSLLVKLCPIKEDAVVDPSCRKHPTSLRDLFVASTSDDDVVGSRMNPTNFVTNTHYTVNVKSIYCKYPIMFTDSKYTRWYYQIIESAKNSVPAVFEKHHIIPRSIGGSNSTENLVRLTPRQHFICHLLLVKMTKGQHKRSMIYASQMMCMKSIKHDRAYKVTSRIYHYLKEERKKFPSPLLGTKLSREVKDKISRSVKGFKHTDEAKAAISANHRCHQTQQTAMKISQSKTGIATRGSGWKTSAETKLKQSLAQKGRQLSEEHKAKLRKPKKKRVTQDASDRLSQPSTRS